MQVALTDNDEQTVATINESESTQDQDCGSKSQLDELPEEWEKELDVWDTFKEEHNKGPFSKVSSTCMCTDFLISYSSQTATVVIASPVRDNHQSFCDQMMEIVSIWIR
jgi:hypothetical protein